MRVIMDGQTITEHAPDFAQGVEMARQRAAEAGRLVIEVLADGVTADELLNRLDDGAASASASGSDSVAQPVAEPITELGITTADKGLFLRETLLNARDALESIRGDQKRAGERIDAGQVAEALSALREIVGGWQSVRAVVDQAAALAGVPLNALTVSTTAGGSMTGDRVIASLASDLSRVRDSVAREDWSLLSETLAFDLDARAAEWSVMIDAIIARTPGAGPV